MMRWLAALGLVAMLASCGDSTDPSSPTSSVPQIPDIAPASSQAVDLLKAGIGARRFVLLGEMHGTREIPALVGDLIAQYLREGKSVALALEITERDQSLVDRYLGSAGTARDRAALLAGEHWQEPTHDGRDSQAMLALIERVRRLRAGGGEVSIVLFDGGGGAQRNKGMADRLRATVRRQPQALVLVLTGNVHAMTSAPPWQMLNDGKPIEPPMTAGRYLADLDPLSIDIRAARGTFWSCVHDGCGIRSMPGQDAQSSASYDTTDASTSAWQATLTLPRFTASPPAVESAPGRASPPN